MQIWHLSLGETLDMLRSVVVTTVGPRWPLPGHSPFPRMLRFVVSLQFLPWARRLGPIRPLLLTLLNSFGLYSTPFLLTSGLYMSIQNASISSLTCITYSTNFSRLQIGLSIIHQIRQYAPNIHSMPNNTSHTIRLI